MFCGMSVFTATTTYDFVAGRQKLFQAGLACSIPGGAFCVAVSWLAGWLAAKTGVLKRAVLFLISGKNWGPEKGRLVSSFR
jgi:hypothetical protein